MGNKIITIIVAIIGVAILATIVSKKAATGELISQAGGAFSNILATVLKPVS